MKHLVCVLTAFCAVAVAVPPAEAQSPSATGYWSGTRSASCCSPASLQMKLSQDASGNVSGTILIRDLDHPSAYALYSATATVSGNSLALQEGSFIEIVEPPDFSWCLRHGTLTFSADGTQLSGPMASSCPTATYTLSRSDISGKLTGDPLDTPGCTTGECPCQTDPINIGTGNVFTQVTDYETAGPNRLGFTRYYNSLPVPATNAVTLGAHWRSTYDRYLAISATSVAAERPDGLVAAFTLTAGVWKPDPFIDLLLVQSGTTWTLTDRNDTVETYKQPATGPARLTTIQARNGYTQTLQYAADDTLLTVTDSFGRVLQFGYQNGLLHTLATPDSLVLTYGYDSSGASAGVTDRLVSVSYSTSPVTSQSYHYAQAGLPFGLTGLTDEDGNTYQSWTYDATGRGTSSQRGTGSTADLTQVVYDDTNWFRTITNSLGAKETYKFAWNSGGVPILLEIDRAAAGAAPAAAKTFGYDANFYIASQTDWNGNLTTYVNEARGLPTSITEASGTPQARTTTITYLATFHLPTKVVKPGVTADLTYDTNGNLLTRTLTDTTTTTVPYSTNGTKRTWTYTWSNGLLASAKGPRTDVSELTSFAYDASGTLIKTINALGQQTQVTQHTGGGLPQTLVDPNGVTTQLAYDGRLRLTSSTTNTAAGALTTQYAWDATGNLVSATLPDGSRVTNTYDTAHRQTAITDLFGQKTAYTLDTLGDRTLVNVTNASNTVRRTRSDSFDPLGRLLQDTGGAGQVTKYTYDNNGNPLTVTDPLNRVTTQAFDALNRLFKVTNPANGITTTTFDAHNRPLSVTVPNGVVTTYVYNGFGDLIQQTSPVTGATVYRYDLAGNLTQRVDATGAVTDYTYDALDRVLAATDPADAAENVAYVYDQPGRGFGIGRLTSVTDAVGTLSRTYDELGNLLSESRIHGAVTLSTSYTYDPASRLASVAYPSGAKAAYARDAMGRVTAVTMTAKNGTALPVASGIGYQPFGPVAALTFGNGIAEARSFDLDYRLTNLTGTGSSAIQNLTYGYNAADDVLSIGDGVSAANSQALTYDALDRLTGATGAYGSLAYTYDSIGNRLTETPSAATVNMLDGLGSINAFAYNQAGRVATVLSGGQQTMQYTYDAFGQRLVKVGTLTATTLSQYDQRGYLLEQTDGQGNTLADYAYLGDRPLATFQPGNGKLNFLHDDRLGTPQRATDSTQSVVWSADYQPFGYTSTGLGIIPQDLRLPGQEFEAETGWNHNGFRDYLPTLGRYLESDPIGLAGGVNTYGYAVGNPLKFIDPDGRNPLAWISTDKNSPKL